MDELIDLTAEVRSAMPAVMAKMRETIIDKMTAEAERVAMDEIRAAVKAWVIAELVPEVRAQLDEGKASLVAQSALISAALGKAIGEAMVENAQKSLANSYVVKEISERLFRGY